MSDDDLLVTVATFDSLMQAELAQGLLDAEGIRSFVADGELVNMAWIMSGVIGGIKLQVAKADFYAAERLLNARKGKSGWAVDDYGLAAPMGAITDDPENVREEGATEAITKDPESRGEESAREGITNEPGIVRQDTTESDDDAPEEEDNEAERVVRAALRAAILGIIACPPLLHLYSLWLLAGLGEMRQPLRGAFRRTFWIALIIDAVAVLGALCFVALMFAGAGAGRR